MFPKSYTGKYTVTRPCTCLCNSLLVFWVFRVLHGYYSTTVTVIRLLYIFPKISRELHGQIHNRVPACVVLYLSTKEKKSRNDYSTAARFLDWIKHYRAHPERETKLNKSPYHYINFYLFTLTPRIYFNSILVLIFT